MKKRFSFLLVSAIVLALTLTMFVVPAVSSTIPTFSIAAVVRDATVTIQTYNFPANDTFTVRMGAYGTQGIGGIVVDTQSSGSGGSFSATYAIPAELAGSYKIAIRLESPTSGYYAFNWFYNNTAVVTVKPTTAVTPGPSPTAKPTTAPGYTGYPIFYIKSVVQDSKVTIDAINFPPHKVFTVRMGAFGTRGVGGIVAGTQDSGVGGSFTWTYTIPAELAGSYKIAIRLEDPISGYYAYNWFYNSTTP